MARKSGARPFLTIDCETDPFKEGRIPRPFLWGCYDGETGEYHEFEEASALVAYLVRFRCLVYAHNGGRFDFHYLRDWFSSDSPIMVINGRIARFKIGEAEFRDSINILVNPLRAFAKEEIDYAKLEPDVRHLHMDEIRSYLRSDCVNLWNTIKRYFDTYGRSLTQAGAAMRYWKNKYEVPFIPQTMVQAEQCRDFYYGGRVECFKVGHELHPFKVVDRNSAYPHAMTFRHPISPHSIALPHLPNSNLSQCFVRLEARSRGAFPWRDPVDPVRALTFPNDDVLREYCVTGWELEAALELDLVKIHRIIDVRKFIQHVDFTDYVMNFYSERMRAKEAGDKMLDVFCKLFLNSLYGKFAADPEKYREYIIATDDSFRRHAERGFLEIAPWGDRSLMERPLPESQHRYYNVATAASITGKVRADLLRAIASVECPLYCDTDSVFARDVSRLDLGDKLGQWKVEADCTEWAIAGKKTYAVRLTDGTWKVRSKGAQLTADEVIRVAHGEAVKFRPEVPTYSVHREVPTFVERIIRSTGKLEKSLHSVN
jgi:hypothetical protein